MKTKEEPVHLEKFTVVFYCGIYWEEESLWDLTSVKGKISVYAVVPWCKMENKTLDNIVYIRAQL